jgi:glycosyltransferase involved in cell wall biosynthesis
LVRKLKPEVLHSYSAYLNFAVHWSTRKTPTIGIGCARSDFAFDWEGSSRWLACLNARWPRKQIYNSFEAAKLASRSKSQFVPKQLIVVRNGVDLDHFRMSPLVNRRTTNIVAIGSLIPVKRWDRLLSAARELRQRNLDFSVRVAGDGPLRGSLEQIIRDSRLDGRVKFLGHMNDIPALLSDASLLVHCSDAEGCPNAVIEAMACGRAVVGTDVGDIASLVEDGKTGFIVSRGDDAKLVERIENLIVDRELCRNMGEAGRAKAEREFGLDHLVSASLGAYRMAGWNDASSDESSLSYAVEHIA